MRVLDAEPVLAELLDNIFHAAEVVIIRYTQDDFGNNKPAKLLIHLLPCSEFDFGMYSA
jgi:hypothetical protein